MNKINEYLSSYDTKTSYVIKWNSPESMDTCDPKSRLMILRRDGTTYIDIIDTGRVPEDCEGWKYLNDLTREQIDFLNNNKSIYPKQLSEQEYVDKSHNGEIKSNMIYLVQNICDSYSILDELSKLKKNGKTLKLNDAIKILDKLNLLDDPESAHEIADMVLLLCIGNQKIYDSFDNVRKWYS